MFEIDSTQTYVPARPEEVVEVYYSVNTILVAPAGHSAEPTKAYIISVKKSSAFLFYIYLFLIDSGRGVLYRREEELVGPKEYPRVVEEAFIFLESMGFIMDRIDLHSLSAGERKEYFQQQPFFPAPEEVPHELTEEVVEEATEPPRELNEEFREDHPVEESRGSESIGQAIQDLVELSPEQGGISDLEKGLKSIDSKAKIDDPAFNIWGRLLASF
jgi:hypothetical protein